MAEGRPDILGFGPYELDLRSGELRRMGVLMKLRGQPIDLLALLAGRAGEVVTREEIQRQLWDSRTFVDFDQGINACIRQIRSALGDTAEDPRWVQTLPRRGYRFLAPVTPRGGEKRPAGEAPASGEALAPSSTRGAPPPPAGTARGIRGERPSDRRGFAGRAIAAAGGLVIALAAVAVAWSPSLTPVGIQESPAIAVLPYVNLSGDPEQDYLSDGLTEELIAQLSRRYGRRLGVIARTTVMRYRDSARSVREIAGDLRVDYVVEGSLRREGDRVRVTSQLIRASDDVHLWAANHERTLDEFLPLQIDLARQIAGALAIQILPAVEEPAAAALPGAYEAYLRGRRFLMSGAAPHAEAGLHLERAVELDPGFAPAWAALGQWRLTLAGGSRASVMEAGEAVRRALMLDDALPEAHALLAEIRLYREWDPEGARREWERAIELDPGSPSLRHDFAAYWAVTGRHDEAIRLMAEAERLDPLAPDVVSDVGWYSYFARRYDEAIEHSYRTLASTPGYYWAHRCIVLASMLKGDPGAALPAAREEMRKGGASAVELAALGSGDAGEALGAYWAWDLDRKSRRRRTRDVVPTELAITHLALGERDAALEALEEAVSMRWGWQLPFLQVDPIFDPLRGDPRFDALLARIGVPAP